MWRLWVNNLYFALFIKKLLYDSRRNRRLAYGPILWYFIMLFDTPSSHFLSLYEKSDQDILKNESYVLTWKKKICHTSLEKHNEE